MIEFRKLKNLEGIKRVREGAILGVGQLIGETIPAVVISNDGKLLSLLGNMDNKVIIEYNFKIDEIEGFYEDGSLNTKLNSSRFIEEGDKKYDSGKKLLIYSGIWEERK